MAPKIATGYELLSLQMEEHIRQYKPRIWCENIGKVTHTPMISPNEANTFEEAHNNGSLEETLRTHEKKQYHPWYVQEAIKDFFDKHNKNF